MKPDWHETIQRYVDGQLSAEEADALFKALNEDSALRALYLDYLNLDLALAAMADAAGVEEHGLSRMTSLHESRSGISSQLWKWAAAAAALAALVIFLVLPGGPKPLPPRQDAAAAIASSHEAVARLAFDTTSALPAWMSPTASLLETPKVPY